MTFDAATGQRMGWNLIDTLASRPQLMELIIEQLNDYFAADADDDEELQLEDWLLLDDTDASRPLAERLPLPSTPPALTEEGLQLVYQQYEIAPYAAGLPTCLIPYKRAKAVLSAEGRRLAGL